MKPEVINYLNTLPSALATNICMATFAYRVPLLALATAAIMCTVRANIDKASWEEESSVEQVESNNTKLMIEH